MQDDIQTLEVLICDDEELFLKQFVDILSNKCKKVYSAKDGESALEIFLQHQKDIDVIITDISMPKLDGISLAKKIREISGENKRIIILSELDNTQYIKEAISLNITRYLAKPIEYELLFRILKEISAVKNDKIHQKELSELLNLTDDYIYISKTDTKGVINYVSSAFCKVSGYTKEELIGKSHNLVRHPDMPKEAFEEMWNIIKSGNVWQGEVKNLKKDGGYYWVEARVSPILDDDKKIIGYKSVRVDITTKKELEKLNKELEDRVKVKVQALREKDEMLQSQSRNALMGEMISMIAHQWRQPLSTISLLVNDINMKFHLETLNEENLKLAIDRTNQTIHYMSKTIDDFREFFKPNKSREYVYIEKIVNNAIGFIEPLIKKYYIDIKIDVRKDDKILVYKNELLQVVINILKNGMDALIETKTQYPKIDIIIEDIDNYKVITFVDNGGGIKDDIIKRIFEPYFSTKTKNGTGLGLYMSKTIIEEHMQGSIRAKNVENGAKFVIKIPFEERDINKYE